jgi:hypothetical protein
MNRRLSRPCFAAESRQESSRSKEVSNDNSLWSNGGSMDVYDNDSTYLGADGTMGEISLAKNLVGCVV